ncbi:MAG: hypothetical protein ACOC2O_02880 [Bacillota bacterium]
MKRKILIMSLLVTLSFFVFSGTSFADEHLNPDHTEMMIGFDFPTVGWAMSNSAGEINGYRGANFMIGYSEKRYFESLRFREFNPYWGWGTVALISPYIEVGGDYPFARQEDGSFFAVGAHIGVGANLGNLNDLGYEGNIFPIPLVSFSYRF